MQQRLACVSRWPLRHFLLEICACVCVHCTVCTLSTIVGSEHCAVCSLILVGAGYEGVGGGRRQSDLETNHICTNNSAQCFVQIYDQHICLYTYLYQHLCSVG